MEGKADVSCAVDQQELKAEIAAKEGQITQLYKRIIRNGDVLLDRFGEEEPIQYAVSLKEVEHPEAMSPVQREKYERAMLIKADFLAQKSLLHEIERLQGMITSSDNSCPRHSGPSGAVSAARKGGRRKRRKTRKHKKRHRRRRSSRHRRSRRRRRHTRRRRHRTGGTLGGNLNNKICFNQSNCPNIETKGFIGGSDIPGTTRQTGGSCGKKHRRRKRGGTQSEKTSIGTYL